MKIPYIFHSTKLTLAPPSTNKYIKQSLLSQKDIFSKLPWTTKLWNEDDLFTMCKDSLWNDIINIELANKLIEKKAWAIISDFLRLYALYTHGGIYADWDVEFLCDISKKIDFAHTNSNIILGFEPCTYKGKNNVQVGAQIALSIPKHNFWKDLCTYFSQKLWTNDFDILPGILTQYLEKHYGLIHHRNQNTYYHLKDNINIFPVDVFYPYRGVKHYDKATITAHTICVHWENSQQENPHSWKKYLPMLKKK